MQLFNLYENLKPTLPKCSYLTFDHTHNFNENPRTSYKHIFISEIQCRQNSIKENRNNSNHNIKAIPVIYKKHRKIGDINITDLPILINYTFPDQDQYF